MQRILLLVQFPYIFFVKYVEAQLAHSGRAVEVAF